MSTELCPHCNAPLPEGAWPFCDDGSGKHGHARPHGGTLLAAIHPSERTVIYRNPKTGEIRTPARNDMPVPEVYARQGYQREELPTPAAIRTFERETGKMHEATHFYKNSAEPERMLTAEPEPMKRDEALTRRLVQAIS